MAGERGRLNPEGRINPGDPESQTNGALLANLKAQAWWELARRAYRTFRWVVHGVPCDADDILSFAPDLPGLEGLLTELTQAVFIKGALLKLVVDKTPDGTKSPNRADAVVMVFWPVLMEGQGIVDYYRRLAEGGGAGAKPVSGAPKDIGGVTLYAPEGTTTVYTRTGEALRVGANRAVLVPAEDAPGLRAAGFTDNPAVGGPA